jgi:magnesium-transporting ATPase (P-type)
MHSAGHKAEEVILALRYRCCGCGADIITQYLKVGEVAKCRMCGAESAVPETAKETTERPFYDMPAISKPAAPESRQGIVRPVWKVLIFMIISLTIYYWIYLFKTIREIQDNFKFGASDRNPKKVRSILACYLMVTIVLFIANIVVSPSMDFQYPVKRTITSLIWPVFSTIISITMFMAFWFSFVDLVYSCQSKMKITPLNKSHYWVLISAYAILLLIVCLTTAGIGIHDVLTSLVFAIIAPLSFLSLLVIIILFCLIVDQVNKLWQEPQQA